MDISTEIFHLQEQLFYRDEKPYTMRYRPEGPAAAEISNVMREKHDVVVLDMRKDLKQYSIDRNGFEVHLLEKHFPPEALENHEEIVEMYLPELKKKLLELFPGCRVDFISYLVRSLPLARTSKH